jgi:hypothetical protein
MREKFAIQSDTIVGPSARGGAMKDMQLISAVQFGVRFIESNNVA